MRKAEIVRKTQETDITLSLNVDGSGQAEIHTGIGFADHMLSLMAFWGGLDIRLSCKGDLHIDTHHSLEDIGLVLGEALAQALGDKHGICRMAAVQVPMDEALSEVISGRSYFVYHGAELLPSGIAGDESDVWREFFKSFAYKAGLNLHISYKYGLNGHHLLEAAFKALGKAIKEAVQIVRDDVSSSKGSLD